METRAAEGEESFCRLGPHRAGWQEPTRPLPWSAPRAHELEMQLDDTNVREAQDRDDAIFNEVAARQDTTQT